MNLFRKIHQESNAEPAASEQKEETLTNNVTQQTTEETETPLLHKETPQTAEESAREWWQQRYGEPMPDTVIRWMKQLTRTEARRMTTASALLTPQRMSRLEEARRLATTKLRNTEQSLLRVRDQLEWLGRYKEKLHELEEHRNRLYQVNKQLASLSDEEQELVRFEAFENVQGRFQRMTIFGRMATQNKEERGAASNRLTELEHSAEELDKRLKQLHDNTEEALRRLLQTRDEVEEANRTLGAEVIFNLDEKSMESFNTTLSEQRSVLQDQCAEFETEGERLEKEITRLNTERQALEPHQQTAEHGEMILTRLERLQEMGEELEELVRNQKSSLHRQQDENEMLSRVFADYQQVENEIRVLNDELHLHRQQNRGRSSYSLQERAMQLKSRRQMLISAQSLWNRISSGYIHIEEKTQRVNQLRLSIEQLKQQTEGLRAQVEPLRKLVHEKEYTLTLSKSQNVIELRSDLQEGTPCTVCGATHHPYHSDTILEQSKLIGDLRTDYELQQAELINKEAQMHELENKLLSEQTRYDVESEALSQLRHRQMEDVREWEVFSKLDRSFEGCTSSTNLEARTAMIRQLIEQTARDADEAQRELDEYNYHQMRINETSEKLTRKEQQKNDLTTRLNEVNTGCQVMAGRVERIQQMHAQLQNRYTQLYEKLGNMLTLSDWYTEWKTNHEGLRLRIVQLMEQWNYLTQSIQEKKHQYELNESALTEKRAENAFLETLQLQLRDERERRNTMRKEGEQALQRVMGDMSVKAYEDNFYQAYAEAKHAEDTQKEATQQVREDMARTQGELKLLTQQGKELDEKSIEARSGLDVWMRQFNANNPPVQYVELERAFEGEKDWNEVRKRVRTTRIEAMLEQARVDQLRSAIVALQAAGHQTATPEGNNPLESLVSQQEVLEKQRQEVLMQIAEQELTLRAHEECKARLKTEEDELYALMNKKE